MWWVTARPEGGTLLRSEVVVTWKDDGFHGAVRNPPKAQVRRLIARILHPTEGLVLCHLDAKVARVEDLEHFRRWARGFHQGAERVQIFSSFSVHRGGRSMLDVQLKALQLLLASPIAWDYYVNLSDTHYPAEAMSWVGSYLWLHRGVNYARITSTKFYDPTLQGGKEATYAGPRREDLFISCDRSLAFECEGQLMSLTPGEGNGGRWEFRPTRVSLPPGGVVGEL
eukprot:g14043.t1